MGSCLKSHRSTVFVWTETHRVASRTSHVTVWNHFTVKQRFTWWLIKQMFKMTWMLREEVCKLWTGNWGYCCTRGSQAGAPVVSIRDYVCVCVCVCVCACSHQPAVHQLYKWSPEQVEDGGRISFARLSVCVTNVQMKLYLHLIRDSESESCKRLFNCIQI